MIFFRMTYTELVVISAWKFTSYYEQISPILSRATKQLARYRYLSTVYWAWFIQGKINFIVLHVKISNWNERINLGTRREKTNRAIYIYTGCPRRKVPNFGRVFLILKYTDITQNTYNQSWTVTEIMAREV